MSERPSSDEVLKRAQCRQLADKRVVPCSIARFLQARQEAAPEVEPDEHKAEQASEAHSLAAYARDNQRQGNNYNQNVDKN